MYKVILLTVWLNNLHDCGIINKYITTVGSTGNGLSHALVHDFGSKVISPTGGTELVSAFQAGHFLCCKKSLPSPEHTTTIYLLCNILYQNLLIMMFAISACFKSESLRVFGENIWNIMIWSKISIGFKNFSNSWWDTVMQEFFFFIITLKISPI